MELPKEPEITAKVVKSCYYLPPIRLAYRWSGLPKIGTVISNYCTREGIAGPEISHNTLNKVLSIRPTASARSIDKVVQWQLNTFPEQFKETISSPLLTSGGYLGFGAVSWLVNISHFVHHLGDSNPYLIRIIQNLITEEKAVVTSALAQDISPTERKRDIYENPTVELLFRGIELPDVLRSEQDLIAGSDDRGAALMCANTLLYFLAAWDAEYTAQIDPENLSKGLFCVLLPKRHIAGSLHLAFWKRTRDIAARQTGEKSTWKLLEQHLSDYPDSARRSLNRYKAGQVIISNESLFSLLDKLFGGDYAETCFPFYLARLKAVVFVSNMFDELNSYLESDDLDLLITKYKTYYICHQEALES